MYFASIISFIFTLTLCGEYSYYLQVKNQEIDLDRLKNLAKDTLLAMGDP